MKRWLSLLLTVMGCVGLLNGCRSGQTVSLSLKNPPNQIQKLALDKLFLSAVFFYESEHESYVFNLQKAEDFQSRIGTEKDGYIQVVTVKASEGEYTLSDWYYLYYDPETKMANGYQYTQKNGVYSYDADRPFSVTSLQVEGEGDSAQLCLNMTEDGENQRKPLFSVQNAVRSDSPVTCVEWYLKGAVNGFGMLQYAMLSDQMRISWKEQHPGFTISSPDLTSYTVLDQNPVLTVPEGKKVGYFSIPVEVTGASGTQTLMFRVLCLTSGDESGLGGEYRIKEITKQRDFSQSQTSDSAESGTESQS